VARAKSAEAAGTAVAPLPAKRMRQAAAGSVALLIAVLIVLVLGAILLTGLAVLPVLLMLGGIARAGYVVFRLVQRRHTGRPS
jgi:type IV secretory pathway VirB2 component (pilin)